MLLPINNKTVPLFGTCDCVAVLLIQDNLVDSAKFAFALGRMTQPPTPPPTQMQDAEGRLVEYLPPTPDPVFTASPISGELVLNGADYAAWSGDNETIAAFVEAMLEPQGLTFKARA